MVLMILFLLYSAYSVMELSSDGFNSCINLFRKPELFDDYFTHVDSFFISSFRISVEVISFLHVKPPGFLFVFFIIYHEYLFANLFFSTFLRFI